MGRLSEELEKRYRDERDPAVKERILLVLRVRCDGIKPAEASRALHKTKGWATKWLKRFQSEGVEGLKTRARSGRPPKLSPQVVSRIRRVLSESKQGWKTKQVEELILRTGGVRYHYTRIYQLMHNWGFRLKVPRKRHINAASAEEKREFKKRQRSS